MAENIEELDSENPLKSRKFLVTLISLLLVTFFSILGVWSSSAAGLLTTFIGGILGILSLYLTGNIMSQHVTNKQMTSAIASFTTVQTVEDNKAKQEEAPGIGFTKQ